MHTVIDIGIDIDAFREKNMLQKICSHAIYKYRSPGIDLAFVHLHMNFVDSNLLPTGIIKRIALYCSQDFPKPLRYCRKDGSGLLHFILNPRENKSVGFRRA